MRREESKGNALPVRAEGAAEGSSKEEPAMRLADHVVTRAQALKLAGLGGAGFLFTLLWPADADARRRRRKKKRRRRKAQVTPATVSPGVTTNLTVTNPSVDRPLTISGVKVLDEDGSVIRTINLPDVTIAPGDTELITITDPLALVDAEGLRLIDERGVPITVVDENGVTVGDIDVA